MTELISQTAKPSKGVRHASGKRDCCGRKGSNVLSWRRKLRLDGFASRQRNSFQPEVTNIHSQMRGWHRPARQVHLAENFKIVAGLQNGGFTARLMISSLSPIRTECSKPHGLHPLIQRLSPVSISIQEAIPLSSTMYMRSPRIAGVGVRGTPIDAIELLGFVASTLWDSYCNKVVTSPPLPDVPMAHRHGSKVCCKLAFQRPPDSRFSLLSSGPPNIPSPVLAFITCGRLPPW